MVHVSGGPGKAVTRGHVSGGYIYSTQQALASSCRGDDQGICTALLEYIHAVVATRTKGFVVDSDC